MSEDENKVQETMADFEKEIEASFKRVREGDILTGTVIDVTDEQVILDLKYYAEGIIKKADLSNDADFNMKEEIHKGDEITATVIKSDDGEGNIVLSRKEANDKMAWDKLNDYLNERTVVKVKINDIVNGGVTTVLEGIRGFIPASRLDAGYVEDFEEFKGKTIDALVITADQANNRLILSGRELAREKLAEERGRLILKCQTGMVMDGLVENIKDYGAFVALENGLSGLLHISQISNVRIKHPSVVLEEGQKIRVKIISTANNQISLSMKDLETDEEVGSDFEYDEKGTASTGLGDLLKNIKL